MLLQVFTALARAWLGTGLTGSWGLAKVVSCSSRFNPPPHTHTHTQRKKKSGHEIKHIMRLCVHHSTCVLRYNVPIRSPDVSGAMAHVMVFSSAKYKPTIKIYNLTIEEVLVRVVVKEGETYCLQESINL